jgi:hypothetical protein
MAKIKKEPIGSTKEPDRLLFYWLSMAKRVKALNLPGLKIQSMGEKEFKPLGEEMNKKKPPSLGVWEWQFDWEAFEFEFHLRIGGKETSLASAKMNVVDMSRRHEVLDSLRTGTSLVTQSEIDAYFKEAQKRAEKSADIQKIDKAIADEKTGIELDQKFVAGLAKSVEGLDRGQRQMDLMPIGDKMKLGSYVQFVYGLDAGFQAYALMKTHFTHDAHRPLQNFPPRIVEQLRKEFGADEKGQPDFQAARKIAVGVIDAKVMPVYRKTMTDQSNDDMRKRVQTIKQLQAKRAHALGG